MSILKSIFQSPPGKTKAAVIAAVKSGYRFIDCANDYDNEHFIGEALQELYAEGIVKRSDWFENSMGKTENLQYFDIM